jgi:hypothetical protein
MYFKGNCRLKGAGGGGGESNALSLKEGVNKKLEILSTAKVLVVNI